MSPCLYAVGAVVSGNGKHKVDPQIENALSAAKPATAPSRSASVFMLENLDFSRCGLATSGYIYRVEPLEKVNRFDLSWIGDMQKALLKKKYPPQGSGLLKDYPDWSITLVDFGCASYWSGLASNDPVWEILTSRFRIAELISNKRVDPTATKGGWRV